MVHFSHRPRLSFLKKKHTFPYRETPVVTKHIPHFGYESLSLVFEVSPWELEAFDKNKKSDRVDEISDPSKYSVVNESDMTKGLIQGWLTG